MTTNCQPIFRFAPSPNGELHLGHAYSAFVTWALAEKLGGRVLLRIEDIDVGRSRERFVEQIYDDLHWLGLDWTEPVRRQSRHFDDYREARERLTALGLLYPSFSSRQEIADAVSNATTALDPDGAPLYPGLHKNLSDKDVLARISAGQRYALRLNMDEAIRVSGKRLSYRAFDGNGKEIVANADPELWGDAVITRKDVPTSYHLSVVVDDALQGVTHVTRGADLKAATDLHRLLQELLDLPVPKYHHHRLINDSRGRKLAKSAKDTSLRSLREDGVMAQDIRKRICSEFGI